MRVRHSTYEYSDPLTPPVVFYERPKGSLEKLQIRVYFTRTPTRHYLTETKGVFYTHRGGRLYYDGEMLFHGVHENYGPRPAWFGPETYMDPEFVSKMKFALAQTALKNGW
jgi:hypothetical protein